VDEIWNLSERVLEVEPTLSLSKIFEDVFKTVGKGLEWITLLSAGANAMGQLDSYRAVNLFDS